MTQTKKIIDEEIYLTLESIISNDKSTIKKKVNDSLSTYMIIDHFIDHLNEERIDHYLHENIPLSELVLIDFYLEYHNNDYCKAKSFANGSTEKKINFLTDTSFKKRSRKKDESLALVTGVEENMAAHAYLALLENEETVSLVKKCRTKRELKGVLLADKLYSHLDQRKEEIVGNGAGIDGILFEFAALYQAQEEEIKMGKELEKIEHYRAKTKKLLEGNLTAKKADEIKTIKKSLSDLRKKYKPNGNTYLKPSIDNLNMQIQVSDQTIETEVEEIIDKALKESSKRKRDKDVDQDVRELNHLIKRLVAVKEYSSRFGVKNKPVNDVIKSLKRSYDNGKDVQAFKQDLLKKQDYINRTYNRIIENKDRPRLMKQTMEIKSNLGEIVKHINGYEARAALYPAVKKLSLEVSKDAEQTSKLFQKEIIDKEMDKAKKKLSEVDTQLIITGNLDNDLTYARLQNEKVTSVGVIYEMFEESLTEVKRKAVHTRRNLNHIYSFVEKREELQNSGRILRDYLSKRFEIGKASRAYNKHMKQTEGREKEFKSYPELIKLVDDNKSYLSRLRFKIVDQAKEKVTSTIVRKEWIKRQLRHLKFYAPKGIGQEIRQIPRSNYCRKQLNHLIEQSLRHDDNLDSARDSLLKIGCIHEVDFDNNYDYLNANLVTHRNRHKNYLDKVGGAGIGMIASLSLSAGILAYFLN